jgi:hypothetical protein
MDRDIWIALCAHRLQRQWRTVDPEQLDEVAGDLWNNERLRQLAPADAAVDWLRPVAGPPAPALATRRNGAHGNT